MKNFKKLISLLFALVICSAFCVTAAAEEAKWGDNYLTDHYSLEVLKGDVNTDGVVDIIDLVRFKKYQADDSTEIDAEAADINDDNAINAEDLVLLKKIILGVN